MDYIQFAEVLEDICTDLGDVELLTFKGDDELAIIRPSMSFYNYRYYSEYGFIIGANDDDSLSCRVSKSGFFIENPDVRDFYEHKDFSKEELICFINEFPKLFNDRIVATCISTEDFIHIVETKNLILEGINKTYYASYDECYDTQEKNVSSIDIAYFSDENKNYYRVELFTTYGMCGSGYTTASWGNMSINMVKDLPSEFTYIPKDEFKLVNNIAEVQDEDYDDCIECGANFGLKVSQEQIIPAFIYYDDYGYDSYYPNGSANISLNDSIKKEFFKEGDYFVDCEEIVPLINLEEEGEFENELDDDFI